MRPSPTPPPRAGGPTPGTESPSATAPPPETISSATLLQGARALYIQHEDTRYTLRLTRQNKLILTK